MKADNVFSDFLIGEEVPEVMLAEAEIPTDTGDSINQGELFSSSDISLSEKKPDKNKEPGKNKKPSSSGDLFEDTDEFKILSNQATKAQLRKHIQTDTLNRLKIETEIVNFKKAAGDVAEFKFMDLMYISYMEKINLDSFKMLKRLKPKFESYIRDKEVSDSIMALLKSEFTKTFEGVKSAQAKEVEKWNQ